MTAGNVRKWRNSAIGGSNCFHYSQTHYWWVNEIHELINVCSSLTVYFINENNFWIEEIARAIKSKLIDKSKFVSDASTKTNQQPSIEEYFSFLQYAFWGDFESDVKRNIFNWLKWNLQLNLEKHETIKNFKTVSTIKTTRMSNITSQRNQTSLRWIHWLVIRNVQTIKISSRKRDRKAKAESHSVEFANKLSLILI